MIRRIDHVNIVVRDLEGMVRFYQEVLGLAVSKRARISGEWVSRTVGLADVEGDVAYLEFGEGPRIELIRYNRPAGVGVEGGDRPNTVGIRHVALTVEGIEELVERLAARGVEFFSDVQAVPTAQVTYAGGVRKRIVYFKDPEGNLLELCEYKV